MHTWHYVRVYLNVTGNITEFSNFSNVLVEFWKIMSFNWCHQLVSKKKAYTRFGTICVCLEPQEVR